VLSIDVKAQLEEILAAFTVTDSLAVLWRDDGSAASFTMIGIYDFTSGNPATLEIDYDPASSTLTPGPGTLTLTGFPPTVTVLSFEGALSDSDDDTYVQLSDGDDPSTFEITLEEAQQPIAGDGTLTIRAKKV
jgi:hypothetical protein